MAGQLAVNATKVQRQPLHAADITGCAVVAAWGSELAARDTAADQELLHHAGLGP